MTKKYKIAVDCGHGKNTYRDTGAKGVPEMAEFEFNSAVSKYAKELLELNGFEVLLTQPLDGNDVPLSTRTNLAIREKVDALFSTHADANRDINANGHWTFYWKNDNKSKRLAEIWDKHANQVMKNSCRGVRESVQGTWSNFHMCRVPSTNQFYQFPAILSENAFMTNAQDLKLLLSDDFRRKCAEVITRTACEYFGMEYKGGNSTMETNLPQVTQTTKVTFEGKELHAWITDQSKSVMEVRELAELVGLGVNWNSKTKTVELYRK